MGIFERFIKALVGKLVLPAQASPNGPFTWFKWLASKSIFTPTEHRKINHAWANFHHKNAFNAETKNGNFIHHIERFDYEINGHQIDTVEISAQEVDFEQDKKPDLAIVYCWGRRDALEAHLHQLATDSLNLNALCVSFNYAGVGESTGEPLSFQDLADHVVAHVKRLKSKGYRDDQIKLYGHSLGGAVEILAAATLQKEGIFISGFADRSLADLKESAKALYQNRAHVKRRWVRAFFGVPLMGAAAFMLAANIMTYVTLALVTLAVTTTFTALLDNLIFAPLNALQDKIMDWTGWTINAAEKFEALQGHDHINIVKPSKEESKPILGDRTTHPEANRDRVIHAADSLHKSLENRRQQKKDVKKQLTEARRLNAPAAEIERLTVLLQDLSNNKCTGGDHSDPLHQLVMRYPAQNRWITAQEKLYDFMRPDGDEHGPHIGPSARTYKKF